MGGPNCVRVEIFKIGEAFRNAYFFTNIALTRTKFIIGRTITRALIGSRQMHLGKPL